MSNLITKNLYSRLTVKFILLFIFGIFSAEIFDCKTVSYTALSFLIFSFIILVFFLKEKRITAGIILIFCMISYISGAFYLNHTNTHTQTDLRSKIDDNLWLYGTVTSSPKLTEKGNHYYVTVDLSHCEKFNNKEEVSGKIQIYVSSWQNRFPRINDKVYFYTKLLKTENSESDFDFVRYLKTKNIYVSGFTDVMYLDTSTSSDVDLINKIKHQGREINMFFETKINNIFSYDINANAVIKGVMLGNKNDFSNELTENFSKSGISHIAAVSGLHLNILIGVISGLLIRLRIRRKYSIILIIPLIVMFSSVVGFTPSVTRASIMLIIAMLASLLKRQYDPLTALFISAFIILIYNPYILFSISFLLSFAATYSIIVLYPVLNECMIKFTKNRMKFISSSFCVSLAAFIGTTPIIAYYFNNISFFSLIANLWVVPLCSVVLIFGFLCLLLSLFLPATILTPILYPLVTSVDLIIKTTNLSSSIPFLSVSVEKPSYYAFFIYIATIYLAYSLYNLRKTP